MGVILQGYIGDFTGGMMEKKMETTSLGFRGLGFGMCRRYP